MFKVRLRNNCLVCKTKIVRPSRYRTYCSRNCRNQATYKKWYAYRQKWQAEKRGKNGPGKIGCLICGRYYVQVCSHVYQVHKMTGREYREVFELEVKRGVVPEWYRKLKGDQALDNKTYKNLETGAKFRFKKGQAGVGVYKRSPITMERLKYLHNFNKK